MSERSLRYFEAINEAHAQLLADDEDVVVLGLGVPGPTGIFGTTKGLQEQFGPERVIDTPSSENAMTGVALGAAIRGKRPVMVHMRVDFALLSMETIVNQAAKWHYMYGGVMNAPLTIRMIIGRGWGQGPQHSQALHSWFAHVPGLKVVMPTRPSDAKGMLIAAVKDDAPVIIFEHRWLYNLSGPVPEHAYETPLYGAEVVRVGNHVTIAATSYMVIEALRAAEMLLPLGIDAEVIDLRSLSPIDGLTLQHSLAKTGHLVIADIGQKDFGTAPQVAAVAMDQAWSSLREAPRIVALPHVPTPTTPALADHFYPDARSIAHQVLDVLGSTKSLPPETSTRRWKDTPDPSFTGPY